MPLIVSFGPPGFVGSVNTIGIGRVRATESIALDGTTTAAAQAGEIALITSTETAVIRVAHGTTPDATATAATAATSAFYAIGPEQTLPVNVRVGDRFNARALA